MHARRARAVVFASVLAATQGAARTGSADGNRSGARRVDVGFMGVELRAVRGGLQVVSVPAGSPAAAAGIAAGDLIVRARGGPASSVDVFTVSVRAAGAGASYPVVLRRGGREVRLDVRLGAVPASGVAVGAPAPALAAQVAAGSGPADLAQLRGRVVVLDFWASWCGPCRLVMPALDRLHQRFAAQGLTVLGVTDEGLGVARSVGAQMALHYTLASDPAAANRFGVTGLPTMVVIDRSGHVRHVAVGADAGEMRRLDAVVRRLLAEPRP